MRTRSILLSVTGLLLLACGGDPTGTVLDGASSLPVAAKPGNPPAAPEIAYSDFGLWVMNRDGSRATRVTPRGAFHNPTWSPLNYGTSASPVYRIAYDAGEVAPIGMVVVSLVNGNPAGSAPVTLVPDGRVPAWSPRGDEIAYIRGDNAIWVMKTDGSGAGHQVAVAESVATYARVTWRSDGLTLAWVEDSETYSGNPVYTIKSSTRTGAGSTTWSFPNALYVVGQSPGGLSSLTWGNTGDSLLLAQQRMVRLLDLTAAGGASLSSLRPGQRPVWSPGDDQILLFPDSTTPRLGVYSLLSGTTSLVTGRIGWGRPDWRRRQPSQVP